MPDETKEYATVRDLHSVESNIKDAIADFRVKMEGCTTTLANSTSEALRVATLADSKASAAHKRMDAWQDMWIKWLVGWLVAALAAGWGLWQMLQEIRMLAQ